MKPDLTHLPDDVLLEALRLREEKCAAEVDGGDKEARRREA